VSSVVEHERRTIQCDNIIFFSTHEKIILRIPLESENQLKIILQIVSQTCCQMAIATRALRALVSIAWQQVFENLSNYFQFILTLL
jgi:hypothetical protein